MTNGDGPWPAQTATDAAMGCCVPGAEKRCHDSTIPFPLILVQVVTVIRDRRDQTWQRLAFPFSSGVSGCSAMCSSLEGKISFQSGVMGTGCPHTPIIHLPYKSGVRGHISKEHAQGLKGVK